MGWDGKFGMIVIGGNILHGDMECCLLYCCVAMLVVCMYVNREGSKAGWDGWEGMVCDGV
jgi:hypothetical protein